jgi:hypothetical protein
MRNVLLRTSQPYRLNLIPFDENWRHRVSKKLINAGFGIALLASSASAQQCQDYDMCVLICRIVNTIVGAIRVVGPTIVALMFTYGAVRYIFSADDPAGRKQGKTICVHALIGGCLLLLISWLIGWVGNPCCPGGYPLCAPIGRI